LYLRKQLTTFFLDRESTNSWCALTTAVKQCNKEMVKFLVLEMKANVNKAYPHSTLSEESPLAIAIWRCDETMIKLLIEELGADVNVRLKRTDSGPAYLPIHVVMEKEATRQVLKLKSLKLTLVHSISHFLN